MSALIQYDLHIISGMDPEKIEKEWKEFIANNNHVVSFQVTATVMNSIASRSVLYTLFVMYLGPGLK